MTLSIAVVIFPGLNCDQDTLWALEELGAQAVPVWHRDPLPKVDGVIIPGGFSYGDYLRSGALAACSPLLGEIRERVEDEAMPVLGICNGFQILTEAGLLPGALRMNASGHFRCTFERVRVVSVPARTWRGFIGQSFLLPIAHHEGAYTIPQAALPGLWAADEVFLQYVDPDGGQDAHYNPNGSMDNIAGVARGSVLGLMPHPERAMGDYLGSQDGRTFLSLWLEGVAEGCGKGGEA